MSLGDIAPQSFEGALNFYTRLQMDARIGKLPILASDVSLFDPIATTTYYGYEKAFVVGTVDGSFNTNDGFNYMHVHNIKLPMKFMYSVGAYKVKGYPLIIQGKDFFEAGMFITGIEYQKHFSSLASVCSVILRKLNNLEFADLLDYYKEENK